MKNIIYILIILLGLGSCTIHENIHFNKNFSGKASYIVDFSAMMTMIPEDSLKNLDDAEIDAIFEEIENLYYGIDGISDFKYEFEMENGIARYSFDFDNLEALNKTYDVDQFDEEMPLGDSPLRKHFSGKKNKLTVELIADESSIDEMDEMAEMMLMMFDTKHQYTFETGIKKMKSKDLDFKISGDQKSAELEVNLGELFEEDIESKKCTFILNKK
jgi:hypothetical protein